MGDIYQSYNIVKTQDLQPNKFVVRAHQNITTALKLFPVLIYGYFFDLVHQYDKPFVILSRYYLTS